ncbi:MAG: hypothetical protein A3H70_04200 [Candidatus Komeilibacteria bacterium RIFCSPLOWO2_02_FULL_48_11]|uniref:D-glycerate dehydrogenase n=1 Tax=Candidatus Komeilibacteria bacterium RIFCSPLOWO2_02_FULL_48_11 TaxID=1798553 RepID=A0A1G2BU03_9BACT|nr:MAG: hypothetical protein A3H70_04200 [Candidatus Komeilibacteria bacterium RIFCSPLOWO2_02_FULL_48_11]
MPKPLVYITRKINKEWLSELAKHCRVKMNSKRTPPTRTEFLAGVKAADVLVPSLVERVDEEVFRVNPKLKIVANYAVGFDNVDLVAAKKYGIPVTNTPGDYAEAVAEHAMAFLLACSRRLVEGDNYVRSGQYKFWDPLLFLGNELRHKKLGIIGTGRIGSWLAQIAKGGFGMDILYYDVARNEDIEKKFQAKKVSLQDLLRQSDYVSVHVPLLPSTRHLLGAKEFKMMKPTAYLINTSRGPVLDERALVVALRNKTIAGAALDVFEFEPKLVAGLVKLPNVVLTPHTASATYFARRQMAEVVTANILDVLVRGQRPRNEIKDNC